MGLGPLFLEECVLRDIDLKMKVGQIENAFNSLGRLVLLPDASVPDACVACGGPAWGNTYHKNFEPLKNSLFLVSFILGSAYLLFGKRYTADFPFCSTCEEDNFRVSLIRFTDDFVMFGGVSGKFLNLLPIAPTEVAERLEDNWFQRIVR